MMQSIPLQAVPSQIVAVYLGTQACTLIVQQKSTGLFLSLYVSNTLVIGGVLCLNATKIVRSAYLGFTGDLAFYDTAGSDDPDYTGLGGRYMLAYVS